MFKVDTDKDFFKNLTADRRGMFLFVLVSRQTKKVILCDLCASAVNKLFSAMIRIKLRLIALNALRYALCPC